MDERVKKAFDFCSDATKQLITLSTGILTLTATFAKEIFKNASGNARLVLIIAWSVYLLSVICGVWTLLAMTGTLEPAGAEAEWAPPRIRGWNVRLPSMVQILAFLLGTLLILLFGVLSL